MTNAELLQEIRDRIERLRLEAKENCPEQTINRNYTPTQWQAIGEYNAYEIVGLFLSTLESEKPMNLDDAMKELDEKIAIVKRSGTWDGVDVDKYMDEVRGRESEKPVQKGLEEAAKEYAEGIIQREDALMCKQAFIAGAKWQKEQDEILKVNYEGARTVYDNTVQHLQEKIDEKYELGKKDMKEQMLKEAVEGEVKDFCFVREVNYSSAKIEFSTIPELKVGDKVRVIVLPKED